LSKIVLTKTTSAIFLAIVLVAGTFALSAPSFMTNAQAQPYYGMDNNQKSYVNDDRDKSKDSGSKSVSINKLKCINNNININGVNSGDINIGNKGGVTEEGYVGANSYSGEGYYNGHSKKDKSFDCIINNNNTNINLVGGGNQTEPLTCEECFTENLNEEQLNNITLALSVSRVGNLEGLCEQLSNTTFTNPQKLLALSALFTNAGITDVDAILRILECLEELRLIIVPPDLGLPGSMR
jgi:hypothetical protein